MSAVTTSAAGAPVALGGGDYPASLALSLLAFHRCVGPIVKGTEAKYGKFADLRTVLDAVTPVLLEQGLVLSQVIEHHSDGTPLLKTRLIHAPSGEEQVSELRLPDLDEQLSRLHQLRLAALQRYPIDLQLAACGAMPLALPPKPQATGAPEAGTSVSLPPARPPGLRLDDQLRGLHSTLQTLGTTTNPLHAIGGALTYFRRYAILALLSLAAEDNDGADYGEPEERPAQGPTRSRRVPPDAAATSGVAPRPAPSRRRQSTAVAAPPRTQEAGAQESGDPAPSPVAASQAAVPELTPAEVQDLISQIRSLPNDQIPGLIGAFREQFQLPADALVSDYIRTRDHAAFIEQQVRQVAAAAA
jgi:hypothetical protein